MTFLGTSYPLVIFIYSFIKEVSMYNQDDLNVYLNEADIIRSEMFADLDYEEGMELVFMKIESMFNCSLLEWV